MPELLRHQFGVLRSREAVQYRCLRREGAGCGRNPSPRQRATGPKGKRKPGWVDPLRCAAG